MRIAGSIAPIRWLSAILVAIAVGAGYLPMPARIRQFRPEPILGAMPMSQRDRQTERDKQPQSQSSTHKKEIAGDRSLSYSDTYPCPVCRHGSLSELVLMEAFACNFCRHIFTVNLSAQTIQVVDSSQPMSWRWMGRGWRSAHQQDAELTVWIWIVGIVWLVVPGSLVALAAYIFPPLPESQGAWLPSTWVALTFLLHGLMTAFLVAEYYQLPFYVASRIRLQRLFSP